MVIGLIPGVPVVWTSPSVFHILIEGMSPYYSPYTASVSPGIPVVWKNPTPSLHTVTHDGCDGTGPCAFDSGAIPPKGSFTLPFLPPGKYAYHCTLHPIMRGILEVQDPHIPAPGQKLVDNSSVLLRNSG